MLGDDMAVPAHGGARWKPPPRHLAMLAAPAVVSAVVGLAGSYVAIKHYLADLGWLSWVAPAVLELTVGYLAVSMVFRARMGTPWRPERLFVYAGIALAVYLNWHAYPNIPDSARLWHAAMPLLWAVAIEWGLAWARALLRLTEPPRQGVPVGVWVTRPWFAASVQRLMWSTGTRTYSDALTRHLHHALARAEHKGAGTQRLTAIRLRYAVVRPSADALSAGDGEPVPPPVHEPVHEPVHGPVRVAGADGESAPRTDGTRNGGPRNGRAPRARTGGGAQALPAPVDRDAVVARLAAELRACETAGQTWRPDYDALMARTGRKRSWCEKAVRDARRSVDPPAEPATAQARTDDTGTGPVRDLATVAGAGS